MISSLITNTTHTVCLCVCNHERDMLFIWGRSGYAGFVFQSQI